MPCAACRRAFSRAEFRAHSHILPLPLGEAGVRAAWAMRLLGLAFRFRRTSDPLTPKRLIMRRSLLLSASILAGSLLTGLLIGQSVANQVEKTDDALTVQGTWIPVKAELAGSIWPDALLKTIVLKMADGKYEVSVAGQLDKGTYKQDSTSRPKGLTIQGTEGPNAGKSFPCIYELDGDTLRVCYDLSGVKAPTEFATAKGTQLYLVTYMRKKD